MIRIFYRERHPRGGWFRLWIFGRWYGPGISWVWLDEPMLFSERYGYIWFVAAFNRRWRWCPMEWSR